MQKDTYMYYRDHSFQLIALKFSNRDNERVIFTNSSRLGTTLRFASGARVW